MFKFKIIFLILLFLSLVKFSYAEEKLTATLFNDTGSISLLRCGQSNPVVIAAGASDTVGTGDIIETGDKSKAHLQFSDGSRIDLQSNTKFEIKTLIKDEAGSRSIFKLFIGTISVFVNKLTGKDDAFEIETPNSVGSVRGTKFQTSVYVDDKYEDNEGKDTTPTPDSSGQDDKGKKDKYVSVLSVEEGEVELSSADRQKILGMVRSGTSVFVTPDMGFYQINEYINLLEYTPEQLKDRTRREIKNYLYKKIPVPNLPW
ncbi:MAG TPA: FecR family protein [Candidatus Eremiobacteraeota bacterium]|nr:MAG: FecR protein [bacterium ADurb.Bin363]HPZ10002.1 FecR family protein [Candidatus Eremiobacteraeota bacterium]